MMAVISLLEGLGFCLVPFFLEQSRKGIWLMGFYKDTFENDLVRGKMGEELVRDTFNALGYELTDTTKCPEMFSKDVDFISADGIKYEVKTDFRFNDTGNFALEAYNYYKRSCEVRDSWLYTSEADFFCFVNPSDTSFFYVAKASDVRAIAKRDLKIREKEGGYKVMGLYLLPYRDYESVFELVETEV